MNVKASVFFAVIVGIAAVALVVCLVKLAFELKVITPMAARTDVRFLDPSAIGPPVWFHEPDAYSEGLYWMPVKR